MEKLWWDRALAFCVTGIEVDLAPTSAPDPARVLDELADRGIELAESPQQIPAALRRGLPAAQLAAAERELIRLAGLGAGARAVQSTRRLNDAERRLAADRPPHWG